MSISMFAQFPRDTKLISDSIRDLAEVAKGMQRSIDILADRIRALENEQPRRAALVDEAGEGKP